MSDIVLAPGLEEEIAKSEGVRGVVERKAAHVDQVAVATAPVETGAFRDSIHVEPGDDNGVRVVADSQNNQGEPDAVYIEFGTSLSPPHATLRRALESAKEA